MIFDTVIILLLVELLDLLKVVSRKGAKEIVLTLKQKGELTYSDIEFIISNPRTTSRRLDELCKAGIIKRKVLSDKYRSVSYSLTQKGEEVIKILTMIEKIEGKKESSA